MVESSPMISFFHFLLLRLPPELAHRIGVLGFRFYQILRFRILRKPIVGRVVIRVAKRFEMKFGSRVGLAAGFDKQADSYGALAAMGFGFVEVGTVTPRPQPGNPKPRIWRTAPGALVNHLGFNSVGLERFQRNLVALRPWVKIPVFANIGKNKDTSNEEAISDYRAGMEALKNHVDGFVVNLSSPNTPGLRALQSTEFLESLAKILPDGLPHFIKLAPDLTVEEIRELCRFILKENRFAGLVLTNTSRGLAEKQGWKAGGLSGPPLFSKSLEYVAEAAEIFKGEKTLIGVGGISSAEDAKEMRAAGADLVEIYTGFVYKGPRLVKEIADALG